MKSWEGHRDSITIGSPLSTVFCTCGGGGENISLPPLVDTRGHLYFMFLILWLTKVLKAAYKRKEGAEIF